MIILGKLVKTFKKFTNKLDNGEFSAREILMGTGILFLLGVIVGIFLSPKDMTIGCNNGNNYFDSYSDDDFE